MLKNKVTLVREGNKFLIKEPGFNNELVSFGAYYLKISGKYILCFECTFKDYFRAGSREKDISNVVFDIVDTEKIDFAQAPYFSSRESKINFRG